MMRRDERGSITPFVVIVSLGLVMLAGLVIDGGRQLNAKGRAIAYAQEAARAGSQAVDVADPRLDLVPALAMKAANAYCDQAMAADPHLVSCRPSLTTINDPAGVFKAVRVTASVEVDAIILGIIGKHVLHTDGVALARPVSGITSPDSGKVTEMSPPSVVPPGQESPGPLESPTVSVSPCVPVPPSPTESPTPDPKPTKTKKGDKPTPSSSPTPWPPPLPPGSPDYCVTPSPGS